MRAPISQLILCTGALVAQAGGGEPSRVDNPTVATKAYANIQGVVSQEQKGDPNSPASGNARGPARHSTPPPAGDSKPPGPGGPDQKSGVIAGKKDAAKRRCPRQ